MDKDSIIKSLEEIAIMLELKNENPFKVRAIEMRHELLKQAI